LDEGGEWIGRFEAREQFVKDSVYFCETCNEVIEGGVELRRHRSKLKDHKLKRHFVLTCANCGQEILDIYAQFSPERNEFWCRACIEKKGYARFREPSDASSVNP